MLKLIRRYIWLKNMGIHKPLRAAMDKNFIRGGSVVKW